jgi:hypothetical protein
VQAGDNGVKFDNGVEFDNGVKSDGAGHGAIVVNVPVRHGDPSDLQRGEYRFFTPATPLDSSAAGSAAINVVIPAFTAARRG